MKKFLVSTLAIMCLCIACDDNTGTLGSSTTPSGDSVTIEPHVYRAVTRSIAVDSVLSRSDKMYLGRFTDPETNSTFEADFIAQFNCAEGGNIFPPKDSIKGGKATKVELNLFFTTYVGDSLNPMTVEVYELDSILQEGAKYYTNIDPTQFYDQESTPLGSRVYTVIDYTLPDSILNDADHYTNVCITLPTEIGDEIIRLYHESPKFFENAQKFINNVCPGYYIKAAYGNGTVLCIDQATLNIYFQHANDSIFATSFASSQEVLQVNRFETAPNSKQHLIDDNTGTYLKTPACIFTEVTLPIDSITTEEYNINSAKITFERYNTTSDSPYQLGTPHRLVMVRKSEMHTFFEKGSSVNNTTSFYTALDTKYNCYEFDNIANLIVYCNNERTEWIEKNCNTNMTAEEAKKAYEELHPDWNQVVLVPVTTIKDSNNNIVSFLHDFNLNSTKLVGNKDLVDVKVITSKFNR